MKKYLKNILYFYFFYILTFTATLGVMFLVMVAMDNHRIDSINPIGSNAVYLSGEACTVNMTYDRKYEELLSDFSACLEKWSEEK